MKNKNPIILLLAALTVLLASCKNSNSPQAVTEKFLNSFVKSDYETAKAISTKNTWGLLGIWASFSKGVPEDVKADKAAGFKVKITGTEKESDSTVIVGYTTEPKLLPFNKLRLLRQMDQEGRERWKVDISTLDLIGADDLYIEQCAKPVEGDTEMETQPSDTITHTED
ncbi:MAG: hypothetical protein QM642_04095 [Edaphocola sp.]